MAKARSIETVPKELAESLQQAEVDNLLEFLSKKPEEELRLKNQQRGDPDMTSEEKLDILRELLNSNPAAFLSRFGHHLKFNHLHSFNSIRNKNYEISFHLKQLERILSPGVKETQAKNRRYEALQRLVDKSDYFTEEEMQRRNPILFEQLIGRFHTKEEREAFLQLSAKPSSSQTEKGQRPTPLSDMLIAHMARAPGEYSDRRIDQENQINEEGIADQYYESGDDDDDESNVDMVGDEDRKQHSVQEEETEEIEDEEKEMLKEEFFTTMYRSFLNGKDEDFDYSSVDNNPEYDCGETLEQDEEEKYFETEDTNSSSSVVEMSESDPKIQTEIGDAHNQTHVNGIGTHNNDDDEEDELDIYMKGIEAELSRQKKFS